MVIPYILKTPATAEIQNWLASTGNGGNSKYIIKNSK